MSQELETTAKAVQKKYRTSIPEAHQHSLDTRLAWLWMQRMGTVQRIHQETKNTEDRMATTLILQCLWEDDLDAIVLLFKRLEGGPQGDEFMALDDEPEPI